MENHLRYNGTILEPEIADLIRKAAKVDRRSINQFFAKAAIEKSIRVLQESDKH